MLDSGFSSTADWTLEFIVCLTPPSNGTVCGFFSLVVIEADWLMSVQEADWLMSMQEAELGQQEEELRCFPSRRRETFFQRLQMKLRVDFCKPGSCFY